MRFWKKQRGFTIVEAIASIAIVSIVVIPLGFYFSNSARTTMNAKRILRANQIAQRYIEQMKIMNYSALVDELGATGQKTYRNDSDASLKEFEVEVELDTTLFDVEEYRITETVEYQSIQWDYIIELGKVKTDALTLRNGANSELVTSIDDPFIGIGTDKRVLEIEYGYDENIHIRHKVNNVMKKLEVPQPAVKNYNVKVICNGISVEVDEDGNLVTGDDLETDIFIKNFTPRPVAIYVFETQDNIVKQPTLIAQEGSIKRYYDIEPNDKNTHRVYKIGVRVLYDGKEYAYINATKTGQ